MATPSQKGLLKDFVINLQLFGEEEVETTKTETPSETEVETETETETQTEEEFDEIQYNKEVVKIPKSERKTYLQKGYNYDKVHGKLSEVEQKVAKLQQLTGLDFDAALEVLEKQQQEREAKVLAEKSGMTEEEAARELERDRKIKDLELKVKANERLATLDKEKAPLKDKLYFSQLEPEIDKMVADNAARGIDVSVEATYYYLRGQKLEELMESEKTKTAKSTVANIQDRQRRGLTTEGEGEATPGLEMVDTDMARAFGNDPKKIAKYVKQAKK